MTLSVYIAGRQFNVTGELAHRKATTKRTSAVTVGTAERGGDNKGEEATGRRKTSSSVADHVRQMAAASTEALERPRKERERFRRFIVDVLTQGECVPGGRKKQPPVADAEEPPADEAAAAATAADKVPSVPSTSAAPLTTGEKDLLR